MAEETTSTTSDQQLSQIINQLLAGKTAQPAVDPNTGPSSREGRGILSLLGEGLGGGSQYGSTAEREQGGISALGAAGARMLQASDWSVMPHTFGSILGQGLDAARGNLGQTQAVSAARQYAAQQLAHQQQEDQIARLKEALPYLQLQEDQRAAARQRELLRGNTSIGAAGDGTYVGAIGGHEGTGQNPNSSAVGVGQFIDSTWGDFIKANPQYFAGMTPEQAMASRKDPEFGKKVGPVAIEWLAKQNADALTKAGVPPSGPVLGIAHYLGAGAAASIAKAPDSAMVSSFVPAAAVAANPELKTMTVGQMKARYANTPNPSFMSAPAPGQAAVAPAASPGTGDPNAKVQIPPPSAAPGQATTPSTGRATLPPPEPATGGRTAQGPEEGTVQVAGTDVGAPTSGVIPPSPPGSDATVAEIEAGRASSPARTGAQPGAVVTAQAGGQQPPATQLPPIKAGDGLITHPGTYSEYRAREYVPPPATEDFNPNLSPAQQAAFASEAKAIEQRALAVSAMRKPDEKSVQDILAAREEIKAKIQMAAQEKAQKAALAITKYNETQDNAIRPRYEKEVDAYKAAAQSNLAQQQELAKVEATAKETRATNREQVQNVAAQKLQEDLNKETVAARDRITALDAALELSRNVKDPTLLASRSIGGVPMVDLLKTIGMGGEAFQSRLGAIQELRAGLSAVTKSLRQGVQLGTASDADLRFITSMGASEMQDDSTREAILTNLIGQQHRKMRYGTEVSKLLAKGMNIGDAMDEAEKRVPEVTPTLPPELEKAPRGDPRVAAWFSRNVPANTIWRTEDGTRHIMHAPGWTPPQ
jgi:hypothetical protein